MPADRPVVSRAGSPNRMLALSPDGTELVYVASKTDPTAGQPMAPTTGLVLRSLATREVRDLPGTEDARQPFFSPEGRWVAFFAGGTGVLKKVVCDGQPNLCIRTPPVLNNVGDLSCRNVHEPAVTTSSFS